MNAITKMQELRAKMKAMEAKQQDAKDGNFSSEPQAFLAHWNIPDGTPLNLRFLPDGDPTNDFFWKERDMINLWFNGIKGGDMSKKVKVVVPCNEMWGPVNSCPVLREVREWYKAKDPVLEEQAQKYWKKKSYLFQCFIAPNSCEVEGDVAPENPIRRILLNKPLFAKVKSILLNPQVQYMPTEYDHGRDFAIIKGKNGGGFAEYDQSQWNFMERPLDEAELAAIEKFGLFNLSEFMPKQPNEAELQAIAEMFEASVNGEAYDPDRWAFAYRPAGVNKPADGAATSQTQVDEDEEHSVPVQVQTQVQTTVATPNAAAAAMAALKATTASTATPANQETVATPAAKATSTTDLLAQLAARKKQ